MRNLPGKLLATDDGTTSAQRGRLKDDDDVVLESKLFRSWTGPFKILRVGPYASTSYEMSVGHMLLSPELPSGMRGVKSNKDVPVIHLKPCFSPVNSDDRPRYLPAGFTEYVVSSWSEKFPTFHGTIMNVDSRLLTLGARE